MDGDRIAKYGDRDSSDDARSRSPELLSYLRVKSTITIELDDR